MGEVTKPVGTGLKGRDLIHSAPLFFKIHGWATAIASEVDNPHSSLSFPELAGPAVATHPLRLIS
jgi:hypothetical protein